MKTAVEWLVDKILTKDEIYDEYGNLIGYKLINTFTSSVDLTEYVNEAKEIEKEQKIKMLNTFLCNAQMGEDVEDVEGWFENYEKQQSFFKPVLGEPIWNITNRTTKQQEQ
jgi:hypothetical protein